VGGSEVESFRLLVDWGFSLIRSHKPPGQVSGGRGSIAWLLRDKSG